MIPDTPSQGQPTPPPPQAPGQPAGQPPVTPPPPPPTPPPSQPPSEPPQASTDWWRRPRNILIGVVAVAIVAAIIAVAATSGGSSSSSSSTPAAAPGHVLPKLGPMGLSEAGLKSFVAGTLKQPVYWAGPRKGYIYELTRTSNRNVYIRYLPPGAKVGNPGANFLIVVTYPFRNALSRLKAVGGGTALPIPGGGIAVPDNGYPKSVHLAFPGSNYEVEVYDPSPRTARAIATSGRIQPIS